MLPTAAKGPIVSYKRHNHVPYKKILYCGSNQHKGNCTHHNQFVGFLALGRIYN